MSPETREALEKSIEHWRQNVAAETPDDVDTSSSACALCRAFASQGCHGCPVAEFTGKPACARTPYSEADSRLARWESYQDYEKARDAWRVAAQAELDFLISLRPQTEGDQA